MGVCDQHHAQAVLLPRKGPVAHCSGGWVPQGRPGRVRKISPPTGIRTQNRPDLNESNTLGYFVSVYAVIEKRV